MLLPEKYTLTHREQFSAVKPLSEKNEERFEVAASLFKDQFKAL